MKDYIYFHCRMLLQKKSLYMHLIEKGNDGELMEFSSELLEETLSMLN